MKKNAYSKSLVLFILLVAGTAVAQNTLPVIPFGERKADLYYWDTNWYDYFERLHPNRQFYPGQKNNYYSQFIGDGFIGRVCMTDTPILVRGIAGAAEVKLAPYSVPTLDTTVSGRRPEWFMMYDEDYNLLGEGRWDTVHPSYSMQFRYGIFQDIVPVYEVYFDRPVLVDGIFYVGGTTHNNLLLGTTGDTIENIMEHLFSIYNIYIGGGPDSTTAGIYCPEPVVSDRLLYRFYWPYKYRYHTPYPGENAEYDTSGFFVQQLLSGTCSFIPFFAIIDTDYVYHECYQPTGIEVIQADADSVVITWDDGGAELWDVELWPVGTPDTNGIHARTDTNCMTLYNLNIDLQYNIRIRTVCDSFNMSHWTDVFQFFPPDYFPDTCAVPWALHVVAIDSGIVELEWVDTLATQWELQLWADSTVPENGLLLQVELDRAIVFNLDTGCWYTAHVRALCDNSDTSNWSDTVHFFLPNYIDNTEPIGVREALPHNTHLIPNPTNGLVRVESAYPIRRVELFSGTGKRLLTVQTAGETVQLDLSRFAAEIYLVRVTSSAGVTTQRLVVK